MTEKKAENLTETTQDARKEKCESLDALLPLVYSELKKIASRRLAAERPDHTLQPTALVHEAYLRLAQQHSVEWNNRSQFLALASEMMRRILVNYALSHKAKKRNEGKTHIALDEAEFSVSGGGISEIDLIFLDDALKELAEFDPQAARVVELKFFGGLTNEEAAETLEVSDSTVKRDWRMARAWLLDKLT